MSQNSLFNSEKLSPSKDDYFTEIKNKKNFETAKNSDKKEKNKNKNNLNVVNLKIEEIKNMGDTMIQTVNNIEKNLNNNFHSIENKINKIDKFEIKNRNINFIDEKIKNIILNDNKLITFIEEKSEKEINNILIQYYEEIVNRLMILYLINKNNPSTAKKYYGLIKKILDCKKINNKNGYNASGKSTAINNRKYKISYNLENNLNYLFKSLND